MEDKFDLIVNSEEGKHLFRAYCLDMAFLLHLVGTLRDIYKEEVLIIGICPTPMHKDILDNLSEGE